MELIQVVNVKVGGSGSTIKDWLPLITVGVTLSLFIVDRILAARNRKRDAANNWYLKVLIEPNLEKITGFFDAVEALFLKATTDLNNAQEGAFNAYNSLKLHQNEKFTDTKRSLESHLLYPLRPRYGLLSSEIDNLFINMYDDYTGALEKTSSFTEQDIKDFNAEVQKRKGELLYLLYLPLNKGWEREILRRNQQIRKS